MSAPSETRTLDAIILLLWVLVIGGLVAVLAGWMRVQDPITGAWLGPDGDWLVMQGQSGQVRTYQIDELSFTQAQATLPDPLYPLAWADPVTMVIERQGRIAIVDLRTLRVHDWMPQKPGNLLLGARGREILAISTDRPDEPIQVFALANFSTSERDWPPEEATGLPFDRVLLPTSVVPAGCQMRLEEGYVYLEHPGLSLDWRRLGWSEPAMGFHLAVIVMAVTLVVMRFTRTWVRRRRRLTARLGAQ